MGRKYKVTEIPQGKEKDYLNLKGVSPDEFDIVKSQLGFRQFRRFLRGKPTSQGNKSEIIEFEDNNGISKKIEHEEIFEHY